MTLPRLLYRFSEVEKHDLSHIGMTGLTLAELSQSGYSVPDGFILSSDAYYHFLKTNNLTVKINHLIGTVRFEDPHSLLQVSSHIRKVIRDAEIDEALARSITDAYTNLGGYDTPVTIIPSLTAESPLGVSFTASKSSFGLAVGETTLLTKITEAWATLFDARNMYYRHEKHIDHFRNGMALVIRTFLPAQASGTLYSMNPLTHDKKTLIIEARLGLPFPDADKQPVDHYLARKDTMEVSQSFIADQSHMRERVGNELHTVRIQDANGTKPKLTHTQIQHLIKLGIDLEKHYYFPIECSWIIHNSKIHILSLKPVTLHPIEETTKTYFPDTSHSGIPLTQGIASGHIRVIEDTHMLKKLLPGEIIVIRKIPISELDLCKKAYGIISEASDYDTESVRLLKTLGYPVIAGVKDAMKTFKNTSVWTINGQTGVITPGGLLRTAFHKKHLAESQKKTATKLFMFLESERDLSQAALYPSDGVGIVDGGSIISALHIHPKKIILEHKQEWYTKRFADPIEKLCRDFSPRPILYRLSALSSTEYRRLEGGKTHEPEEDNPLLGNRGGIRYLHDTKLFLPELEAIKRLRDSGLTNLHLILPFIRSPRELEKTITILRKTGLTNSHSFKLWLSIDTPAQTILIDQYLKYDIDGVLLNPDSLSQLFVGADAQNSEVSALLHDDHDALLYAYQYCIKRAHRHDKPVLISLRFPSDQDRMIEKLIGWGVTGIIVKPDSIENIRKTIYKYERKLIG